jgi:Carboxypeptidase regulatory-like domain/TonB dependent receptor
MESLIRMVRPHAIRSALCVLVFAAFGSSASTAAAQSTSSGTIHGTVKDETGGALPGVTVTISSPALQVPAATAVTGVDGDYRFVDLPAGTYRATFELPGFATLIRDGLLLTVGFVARVDAELKVGAVEEAVTVSGQSPVVDVTSTSASVAFTRETLEAVPRGRDIQNVLAMAPGVTQATPDVGGSTLANRQNISSYGLNAQPRILVEGMAISMGADTNPAIYFMTDTVEEVQVKTSGNDAEVSVPGISVVGVLKSGGNQFHGVYNAGFQTPRLQASNIDATLAAQGLKDTAPLKNFYDAAGDIGGPVMKDTLWFYAARSRQKKSAGLVGFAASPGPDHTYLTADDELADFHSLLDQYTAKLSYQISKTNRFVYVYQRGTKHEPENGAGRFTPLESTRDYANPGWIWKGELQSSPNARTLVNVLFGTTEYYTDYDASRSYARADAPSRMDLETGLNTGSHPLHQNKTRDHHSVDGSLTFFPERTLAGKHELKAGISLSFDRTSDGYLDNLAGNYILETDKISGASGTPARIVIYNTPVRPLDSENTYAVFLKDTWRVTDHLTANVGVRWERQHSYLPAQSREAARDFPTIFPAASYSQIEVGTWNRTVPRVGVAYDIGRKSVVKASVGEYNYIFGDTFGDRYNGNATGTATYIWHDVNGNKLYDPGEVNLNLNGADFISITSASSAIINPTLREPKTWETTVSFEREVAPNLGARVMYIDRVLTDYFSGNGPNILRPYSAYSIPITRRDPGPDGILGNADDAGPVTFYDYTAAYRGASFVATQVTNFPNNDHPRSLEFTMTRRASGRWSAQASYFVVKNHQWLQKTVNSPDDEFFPLDETWNWGATVTGTYRLPYDVYLSGFLQGRNGLLGQRTYTFRQVDPDGGTPIAQLNNVTLPLEPFGARRLPAVNIVNLRASKEFSLGAARRLAFDFDIFNALNSNAPLAATFASGPTFGYVTNALPPRIARFGVRFRF